MFEYVFMQRGILWEFFRAIIPLVGVTVVIAPFYDWRCSFTYLLAGVAGGMIAGINPGLPSNCRLFVSFALRVKWHERTKTCCA